MIQTLANSKAVFLADGPRHDKKRQGIKHCGRGCSSSNQAWLETQMSFKEPLLVVILSRKNKTKRHLDATDTHSNQSLHPWRIPYHKILRTLSYSRFSKEQQLFYLRQALEHAHHHPQQLPDGHLAQSNCCFPC